MVSSKGSTLKRGTKSSGKKVLCPVIVPGLPPKWVVVQLSSLGEKEKNLDLITRSAQRILGEVEVFIPAVAQKVRNESHTMFYMDGYIFIRHHGGLNYLKLQDTTYFKTVLCNPGPGGRKTYCLLDDFVLNGMRDGVRDLRTKGMFHDGQEVKIVRGSLKGLRGTVNLVYENGEKVQVFVPLQSKPVLIEFPPNYLSIELL